MEIKVNTTLYNFLGTTCADAFKAAAGVCGALVQVVPMGPG